MIRVNLLPRKQKKDRLASSGGGQKWLLVVLVFLVLEMVGLVIFHQSKVSDLEDQKDANVELRGEIKELRDLVANHEEVKKELELLRAREDAIGKLKAARTGPTAVLVELAQVLTPGKGPTADPETLRQLQKDNPLQVYNPGWDARRLWLKRFVETDRVVRIEGLARDSADVSELAYRLKTSDYFHDVRLLPGKKVQGKTAKDVEFVEFAIEMKVRY